MSQEKKKLDKNEEEVLVIPRGSLDPEAFTGSYSNFCDILQKSGIFIKRKFAEVDENFLQVIPYVVVSAKDSSGSKFVFTYKRLKAGSEARLHDRYSIGVGGHIEYSKDYVGPDTNDKVNCIIKGAIRELQEEITVNSISPSRLAVANDSNFLIYLSDTAVDRVHIGVLLEIDIGRLDIAPREITKLSGCMKKLSELKTSELQFENWTKKALQCIAN